ncbi:Intraflagellar transport protein 74 [Dermatophagoides pteronyssinus]|uniref:Intraflagellar transport protein 74 n=2 Tax=Dermatophagoides pteronyssinus TaxID=6956 RepID=A0ABQ8JEB8_DERPT|nr:intraflagellar transport protein 74 homolog [Dermatophagoides pteronyssinus]KAH9420777.1 Intraflagellar transport protein 74 [Dermatophagoides pteronyssinus]
METLKSARPLTSRPLTSAHQNITNTGLIAPKSSRGKTALRRQIQDKSYFIGLLRMKINELNAENNSLLRECEIMTKEEARIGVYRQKAETFARELNDLTLELMTYNEFVDRTRIDDEMSAVKDDTNEIKHENEALIANLENDYAKLRDLENVIKRNDEKLKEVQKLISIVKNKFSETQIKEFDLMQTMNNELTKECHLLEQEISLWRMKKNEIEEKTVRDGNIMKMELIKAITKLRNLEKQKNKLLNAEDSEENERKHLLAQVKRDNNYINSLTNQMEQLNTSLNQIKSEIEFYKDGDKLLKFSDLRQQDKIFDDFMIDYNNRKRTLIDELETINHEINDTTNKLSRYLKYLNIIKRMRNDTNSVYDMSNEIIIQKRKLELEIYKNTQAKEKAELEKETLSARISKLNEGIKSYSDVAGLKSQVESKLKTVKQNSETVRGVIQSLKIDKDKMASEAKEIELKMEKDDNHRQIVALEKELSQILLINNKLKENDNSQMISEMKAMILDNVKKYNQSLIGF